MDEDIVNYLIISDVDFVCGGGIRYFLGNKRKDRQRFVLRLKRSNKDALIL